MEAAKSLFLKTFQATLDGFLFLKGTLLTLSLPIKFTSKFK